MKMCDVDREGGKSRIDGMGGNGMGEWGGTERGNGEEKE